MVRISVLIAAHPIRKVTSHKLILMFINCYLHRSVSEAPGLVVVVVGFVVVVVVVVFVVEVEVVVVVVVSTLAPSIVGKTKPFDSVPLKMLKSFYEMLRSF